MCVCVCKNRSEGHRGMEAEDQPRGEQEQKHIANKGQRVMERYGGRLWRVLYAMFRNLAFISDSMFWEAIKEF